MQIEVAGIGLIDYEENELLNFPDGLYGFEELHKYLPVPIEESDRIFVLQSIEEPLISFILVNPFMIMEDYEPKPTASDMKELGNPKMEDVSFYVICSLKSDIKESTLNLKCPIAVNALSREAKQLILEDSPYQLRHRFGDYEMESLLKEG